MRLIDADWLEGLLLAHEQNARSIEKSGKKVSFTYADGIRTVYADVGLCPTVDAKPVRHGRWIEQDGFDGDEYYDCSLCGNSWTIIDGTPQDNGMNYCPNCGAKMDGERGEDGVES